MITVIKAVLDMTKRKGKSRVLLGFDDIRMRQIAKKLRRKRKKNEKRRNARDKKRWKISLFLLLFAIVYDDTYFRFLNMKHMEFIWNISFS